MHREFSVDGLVYEFSTGPDNSVSLGVIGGGSPCFRPEPDSLEWGAPIYVTGDEACSRYPIRVARQAITLLHGWIGAERPKYFSYCASTERRMSLYRRIAQQTAARFGYAWHSHEDHFYFYKCGQ